MKINLMKKQRSLHLMMRYHPQVFLKAIWWRTTSIATKTRYHDAGGALSRAWIYLLIFISLL